MSLGHLKTFLIVCIKIVQSREQLCSFWRCDTKHICTYTHSGGISPKLLNTHGLVKCFDIIYNCCTRIYLMTAIENKIIFCIQSFIQRVCAYV